MLERSTIDLARAVKRGDISALELTEASLSRIESQASLAAFVSVAGDTAREHARAIDDKRARGETLGPLAGVPIGIKDALCTRDQPTTAGSRILTHGISSEGVAERPYVPPYDATVVAKLRAADAVLIGKCNMDEFAMGSSNENSAYGPTLNPWDTTRTPGGSSGGSAVAVAAAMAPCALGSDTGGSVRQPASLTGVVGIKPSYGRVSRYGLIAFASSLDQVGPLASDVRGAAALLEVVAGHDVRDATSVERDVPKYVEACDRGVKGMRIGVPEEYFAEGLDDEVASRVRDAIAALEKEGASVTSIALPHTASAVATYYIVATAECSSNLARFDGVRFGMRVEKGNDIGEMYRQSRSAGFGDEVKRRIMLGTYVLSAGYYDAYYRRAQRVRTLIARDFAEAFANVDIIATPVSPTVAFPLGERVDDPLAMYLADVYTLPASLAGISAISVPCGLGSDSDMPVGLQLIAPAFEEERLLAAAAVTESTAPALPKIGTRLQ
jgi:aspartyl-tRNA(Asn)/glutamyl-tRNA(Gln) amidotransferase subunit A